MNIKIRTAEEFKPINWAGGISTQLFIYPSDADYKQRNFDFRLSTATVEIEQSEFTSLPGISRKLMILEGTINITHENHYNKKLGKFDTDTFEGDWKTSSVGKCIDFNLMTRNNTKGELSALSLGKNQIINDPINKEIDYLILYAFSGEICLNANEETHRLQKGNLLVITQFNNLNLKLTGIKDSEMVISKITTS